MSFVLYALLSDGSPEVTPELLATDLEKYFRKSRGFSIGFEKIPFSKDRSVRLEWDEWSAVLTYKEGSSVLKDSKEIKEILGENAPEFLSKIFKRIHVFFADDDEKKHTTEIVDLIAFLEEIKCSIIFDPQQRKIIN